MPTKIEMTSPTAFHARLETMSEILDKLADRFFRSYAIDLPDFDYMSVGGDMDYLAFTLKFQTVLTADIRIHTATGAVEWVEVMSSGYDIEPCDRTIDIDSDADWDWINARVREVLAVTRE